MRRASIVKHEFLEQLNRKSLKYNWHDAEVTVLEGVFARGDRRVGKVLEEAYRLGCLYDSWTETFHNELWMQAFANMGIDPEFYTLRERDQDELFPWDFIDIGVTKTFLKREWESGNGRHCNTELPDAVFRMRCGILMEEASVMKARIKFRKYGVLRFIGHLDVMRFFQKVMRQGADTDCFHGRLQSSHDHVFCKPVGDRTYK